MNKSYYYRSIYAKEYHDYINHLIFYRCEIFFIDTLRTSTFTSLQMRTSYNHYSRATTKQKEYFLICVRIIDAYHGFKVDYGKIYGIKKKYSKL